MSEPAQEARRSPKRWLGAAIKIAIAVALLAYVFNQPKFHARQLVDATRSPWFALSLAVGVVAVTLTGVRWGVLLSGEGVRLPILRVLKLTWIGHFWNMIIPGSVTGDVVKMFYVGKEAPDRREEAWTTVFADRVIGLTALITVSVVAALSRLDLLAARPGLQAAVVTMGAALVAVTLAWVGVISGLLLRWSLLLRLLDRIGQRDLFDRVHDTLARIARHPRRWRSRSESRWCATGCG